MKEINEFTNEIYPRRLWIAFDGKDIIKETFTGPEDEVFKDEDFQDSFGTTLEAVLKGDIRWKGVVINYTKDLLEEGGSQIVSTITHESIHAANVIFSNLGIHYTSYDDEHFAYLAGWVSKKSWEVLQNHIPK